MVSVSFHLQSKIFCIGNKNPLGNKCRQPLGRLNHQKHKLLYGQSDTISRFEFSVSAMTATIQEINRLLPQTQCRECGYDGCLPYAQALSDRTAPVNLCAPGGTSVIADLSRLLDTPALPAEKQHQKSIAWIDESVCIGCTACIRACPVDAIMGASKWMHTVIKDECTGCNLCVAPCPVDCIHMKPVEQDYLPLARSLSQSASPRFAAAEHAQRRYEQRNARKTRDEAEKKSLLAKREAAVKAGIGQTPANRPSSSFNPSSLIAKAMAQAQAQQSRLVSSENRADFKAKQIAEAKERAELRRAQRDMKYGNEAEKSAALAYLRAYKAKQEAEKEQHSH